MSRVSGATGVLTVVGARLQFVEAAPVGQALSAAGHDEILVHTGQHYDDVLSDVFFRDLEITRPAVKLGVGARQIGSSVR